ncbi:unnamed protein product [Bursaphelenchus okinawaensis]|uniref:GOST seven transmembrane domain-containing protein n=1 Tax=Bursaphelenchus okinawaensis TaxID=465554 RepID=A0A811KEP6_9BILA|nr:unnamed protein product [Bursaphelenchus okinawaensis]CAG9101843.1 unnamed protein product [Bursaphelenchus okinawaensis]
MKETVELQANAQEYVGFLQSALKNSEVEIRVRCQKEEDVDFTLTYVIRSSPCAKEFFVDRSRFNIVTNLLSEYFNNGESVADGYTYKQFYYYKSKEFKYNCKTLNGADEALEETSVHPMIFKDLSKKVNLNSTIRKTKRSVYPGLNGETIDGGAKKSLTSWHPAQQLPVDAAYLLIVRVQTLSQEKDLTAKPKIEVEAQWRGPHGFLSAIDYPLLSFYEFMIWFYLILAVIWFVVCCRHYKDLLRIQYCIGVVIVIGLLEKTLFYAEYSNMNAYGQSKEGLIEAAELMSCFKRTVAHVLVIIVSVGYGVVKPRLGSTMNQVVLTGGAYFILCSIEGLTRVSMRTTESMKEKQVAKVPLAFLEVAIAWWVFSSLVNTMRALRVRRNEVKLSLYRQFTNVLALAMGFAVIFMLWSLYIHIVQHCMEDWKELWVDTAFWHVFFCVILVMIMVLWRPSQNNQRYAFTPLLDNSEDENDDADDDVLFTNTQNGLFEEVKMRNVKDNKSDENKKKSNVADELDWIEKNIPTSLAEALIDDDEEREKRELEASKML